MGRDYAVTYKVIKDSYSDEIGFIWHFLPVVNVFIILIVIIYIIFHYLKKIKNISLVKKADVFIDNLLNKLDGNSKN